MALPNEPKQLELSGDDIVNLVKDASNRIVIIAPYIKSFALRRLLKELPNEVSELICVTRWNPEDIAAGVCDIEIFDQLKKVRGGSLKIHSRLHAKYYSNGHQAYVGSANLTARGLGWHRTSNLELLIALSHENTELSLWEKSVLDASVVVTSKLRDEIVEEAEKLKQNYSRQNIQEVETDSFDTEGYMWYPQCSAPDRLWDVYRGKGKDKMPSSAFQAAEDDLKVLTIPGGLSEVHFNSMVASILSKMPFIVDIDKLTDSGLTDAAAKEFIANRLAKNSLDKGLDDDWRTIKAWLVHFFPRIYRRETDQEVLVKGRDLTQQ